MKALNISEVRNNLSDVLDKVVEDFEPTIVTRRGDKGGSRSVIIISLDSYNAMNETSYLLSGNNRARLMESIGQLRAGKAKERRLIEHEDEVA